MPFPKPSTSIILNDSAVLHRYLFDIRDPQTGAKKFREALEKIGEHVGAHVLQSLERSPLEIKTITNSFASHLVSHEKPILVTILRAGLPLLSGVQKIFPDSEVGFLGMARNEKTLKAETTYVAVPSMQGKTVIIVDTMLGTGGSMVDAIKIIQNYHPSKIILISAIASQTGVDRIKSECPHVEILVAATDPDLNDKGYIVPGLGDAGDRSFGVTLRT